LPSPDQVSDFAGKEVDLRTIDGGDRKH